MKPYASYKPSGVTWLGEVPEHWQVKKIKHLCSMRSGEGITAEDIEAFGAYPVYGGNGLRGYSESFTHVGEYLLVGRQGALCGNVHQVSGQFWASEHAVVATFYAGDNVSWAKYLFEFMNLGQYSVAAAQPGLAVDSIQQLYTLAPPIDEQQAIADYLDTETARIDELMREKETLIGLLREYRQSVIAEAVLKGLNPDVPLKPSGVPWLGEVPAHWEVKKVKFLAQLVGGKTADVATGVRYVGLEHVEAETGKFVAETDGMQTEAESTVNVFESGCVLFGKLRPYLAKAVVADTDGVCSSEFLVLRSTGMNAEYLKQCLLLDSVIKTIDASTFGSKMPRADWTFISQLGLPQPPLAEQQVIADYLDTETARLDSLITHTHEEIKLLKELRTATIADAVLGRVDVRLLQG